MPSKSLEGLPCRDSARNNGPPARKISSPAIAITKMMAKVIVIDASNVHRFSLRAVGLRWLPFILFFSRPFSFRSRPIPTPKTPVAVATWWPFHLWDNTKCRPALRDGPILEWVAMGTIRLPDQRFNGGRDGRGRACSCVSNDKPRGGAPGALTVDAQNIALSNSDAACLRLMTSTHSAVPADRCARQHGGSSDAFHPVSAQARRNDADL